MNKMRILKLFLLFTFLLIVKNSLANPNDTANANLVHVLVEQLSQAVIQDGFNPPQAIRIYAYCNITAYEALINSAKNYSSLGNQLNGLGDVPKPDAKLQYDFRYAAVVAFSKVARSLVYRIFVTDATEKNLLAKLEKENTPQPTIDNSKKYGNELADFMIAWIKNDNFTQLKTMQRYELKGTPGSWEPTPPGYLDAAEPNWCKIRPLVMKSVDQFKPSPPHEFSEDTASQFYKEAIEVYNTVNELTRDRLIIAKYWDDSPAHIETSGHFMYVSRKLTPGGHWMNIIKIVAKDKQLNMLESIRAYTLGSITMFDAFISCWDEKFKSDVIRPETYINRYIEPNWQPVFETPPFPEYTSGHSVASASIATIITAVIGDNIAFVDSSEVPFNLSFRKYKSFNDAANEAAMSRLYAGIHYRKAIEEGQKQGRAVANNVLKTLKTKED